MLLLGPTQPDKIQLGKALLKWVDTSHFLDDEFTALAKPGPDGQRKLPQHWRLGSKPNLIQMHNDACLRVADLIEAKLLKTIEGLKALTAGTEGDGYKVTAHNLPAKPERPHRRRRVPFRRARPEGGLDLGQPERRGPAVPR